MSTATVSGGISAVGAAKVGKNKLATMAKPTEFISHSPYLIEGFKCSSQEFYARVEKALVDRQIPDLEMERVDWKEGGALSARREYLRVSRERLVFDICAAPFGTGFFVSLWHGEKPLKIGLFAWCLLLLSPLALVSYLSRTPDNLYRLITRELALSPPVVIGVCLAFMILGIALVIGRAGPDLDNRLIRNPVLGYFYERFIRTITHWRVDRTCMYLAAVHSAVMQVIDEVSEAQGIAPLSEFNRRPPWEGVRERPGVPGSPR
jgi:hypothetical protein